jgi:hypothetical protein
MRWLKGTLHSVKRSVARGCGAITFTTAGKHHVEVGDAAVRDPGLAAVQNGVVPFNAGAALHGGYVRARIRFAERKGGNRLTAGHLGQVTLLLLGCAGQADGAGTQALHCKCEVGKTRVAGERLADQADGAGVDRITGATVGCATHGVFQPAGRAQLAHQRFAFGIHIVAMRLRDVFRGPCVQRAGQVAVLGREEGPVQVCGIAHNVCP